MSRVCCVLVPQHDSAMAATGALLLKAGFETARPLVLLHPRVVAAALTEHEITGCVACGVGGPYGSHAGLVCLMQLLGEVATVHTDVKIVMKSTILE